MLVCKDVVAAVLVDKLAVYLATQQHLSNNPGMLPRAGWLHVAGKAPMNKRALDIPPHVCCMIHQAGVAVSQFVDSGAFACYCSIPALRCGLIGLCGVDAEAVSCMVQWHRHSAVAFAL